MEALAVVVEVVVVVEVANDESAVDEVAGLLSIESCPGSGGS